MISNTARMSFAAVMHDTVTRHKEMPAIRLHNMKGPVAASLLFHACVFVLSIVTLPYLRSDLPLRDISVPVEIVEIAKKTKTDKMPALTALRKVKPKEEKKPEPKKVSPKPHPPQVLAKTPPKPKVPQPPELLKKAVLEKPVSRPKKRPILTSPDRQEEDFDKVLRNLMPSEPLDVAEPAPQAPLADRMTRSELSALNDQISGCWGLQAGARYAENLVVPVRIYVNPDRTVRDVRVIEQWRYNSDSYYRAAADSALRAVRHPRCNPLDLPPGKYKEWKEIKFIFDPRNMLQ